MRDIIVYIEDMIFSIDSILTYCRSIDFDVFESNQQLQDAVHRRLEILGEAAKHVPESIRKKHPNVQWKAIAGLRDVLINSYSTVDNHKVWNVIQDDLKGLREELIAIKKEIAK